MNRQPNTPWCTTSASSPFTTIPPNGRPNARQEETRITIVRVKSSPFCYSRKWPRAGVNGIIRTARSPWCLKPRVLCLPCEGDSFRTRQLPANFSLGDPSALGRASASKFKNACIPNSRARLAPRLARGAGSRYNDQEEP